MLGTLAALVQPKPAMAQLKQRSVDVSQRQPLQRTQKPRSRPKPG
jgi:hypothetical protein